MVIDHFLAQCATHPPIIVVATVDNPTDGVSLARALQVAGIHFLEITLRTNAGLEAIHQIRREVSGLCTGAGTLRSPDEITQAVAAGAEFLVSPGATPVLLQHASELDVPYLPGIATVSEALAARELGYRLLKFFPADLSGGTAFLDHLKSVMPDLTFCPTAGVNINNLDDYLTRSNVVCVGGSWIAPAELIQRGDWAAITARATATIDIASQLPQ